MRARALSRTLARLLRRSGATVAIPHVAVNDRDHLAHQVGTCRAGLDATTSVVDRDGALHGEENVRIVDGSVFPTSLGVGPALTIAAHALRVVDRLVGTRRGDATDLHRPCKGDRSS
jgi:choline dehydrogenase-like flavoprotein